MLGKLLKYEIKATSRLFIPIYLAILLFALINRVINPFQQVGNEMGITIDGGFSFVTLIQIISISVYFALIVAVIAMTLVIIIQRFYKNLLGDEGYLMFTLPVKPWQHIVSKLVVSTMWNILSFIIIVSSILILTKAKNVFSELGRLIAIAQDFFGGNTMLILIPVLALIGAAFFVITVYNAMAIGHLFIKHRVLASFGAYIGIYMIVQVVNALSIALLANSLLRPLAQSA
ncbi:MAG: ABC transporter permease, partial [Clostridiales bacterium]|nr:ABC transporter permease [Clostridiales bacterium]